MSRDDEIFRDDDKVPSAIAQEVSRLKKAAFKAMETRAKLPQPLFWSAFGHAISQLRAQKERARELRDIFEP